MGKRLYSNLASTTLSASISSIDLSLTVNDPSNFPSITSGSGDYFIVTLSDTSGNFEYVKVTGISGSSMTIDSAGRGLEGTTARSWNAGDFVELCATAGSFSDLIDGKADKATPAAAGNVAELDSTGNLQDSGVQLSSKADKTVPAAANNIAVLDSTGNLADGGNTVDRLYGHNYIIDGEFRIRYGGTSFSFLGIKSGYTATMWVSRCYLALANYNVELIAEGPENGSSALRVRTTATQTGISAPEYVTVLQKLAGDDINRLSFGTSAARTITLSFYVRASIAGRYCVAIQNGSLINRSFVHEFTVNTAGVWEKKTVVIPGDTGGTWTSDSTEGFRLVFTVVAGSDAQTSMLDSWVSGNYYASTTISNALLATAGATFDITRVKLEPGNVATEFVYNYAQEMYRTYRYYVPGEQYTMWGAFETTTRVALYIRFPTQMRTSPTVVRKTAVAISSAAGGFTDNGSLDGAFSNPHGATFGFYVSSGSATVGLPAVLNNFSVEFDARL